MLALETLQQSNVSWSSVEEETKYETAIGISLSSHKICSQPPKIAVLLLKGLLDGMLGNFMLNHLVDTSLHHRTFGQKGNRTRRQSHIDIARRIATGKLCLCDSQCCDLFFRIFSVIRRCGSGLRNAAHLSNERQFFGRSNVISGLMDGYYLFILREVAAFQKSGPSRTSRSGG